VFSIFKTKPKLSDLIPEGAVDIHSHVLPGIDDGAPDISHTTKLLEGLRKIGFTQCIATPHTLPEIWDNTTIGIKDNFKSTKQILEEPNQTMLYHVASEYMVNESFLERLQSEPLLTIKDNIVLIEMKNIKTN